jgi:hypothetical protein
MNNKTNLYLALATALLVFTTIWAQQGRLIATYQVGSDTDTGHIRFDVLTAPQSVTVEFDVITPIDTAITATAILGPNSVPLTRVSKIPDPNGWRTTYQCDLTFTTVGAYFLDITVQAQGAQPKIEPGRGIVMAPRLDPNYDYALARTDPIAYQKAKKHQQRWEFLNGLALTLNPRF